jgi:hypothetical protein
MAADEASYNCVVEMEDAEGHRGVKLSKDLMKIAGEFLRACLAAAGRHSGLLAMPFSLLSAASSASVCVSCHALYTADAFSKQCWCVFLCLQARP